MSRQARYLGKRLKQNGRAGEQTVWGMRHDEQPKLLGDKKLAVSGAEDLSH